jgi:2'-5' RNA ligase
MRLFVALRPPARAREEIASIQERLVAADRRDEIRWTGASGIHLTLRFLGEMADPRVEAAAAALDVVAARSRAPRLAVGAAGGFPTRVRPRVVWLGLDEQGERLESLAHAVASALAPFAPPEERPFQAHVTVGRRRESGGRAGALARPLAAELARPRVPATAEPWTDLALVRSVLGRGGSTYTDVRAWQLATP